MSMIPEIPTAELKINAWHPISTGFVTRQDTHVSITHLATQIYVESSDERSIHRARAVAMEKFEKAWAEYWSKPTIKTFKQFLKSETGIYNEFHSDLKMISIFKRFWDAALASQSQSQQRCPIEPVQDEACSLCMSGEVSCLASQSQQQNAWQQAIDDELVNTHLGIAKDGITREEAKAQLNKLIAWHIDVAKYFDSQAQQESLDAKREYSQTTGNAFIHIPPAPQRCQVKDRFKIIEGSQSGHCCFEYTIVDTEKPTTVNGKDDSVCECFEKEDAKLICDALNKANN